MKGGKLTKMVALIMATFFLVCGSLTHAKWECDLTNFNDPNATPEYRCIERTTGTFETLRGCLRCEDDYSESERPDLKAVPPKDCRGALTNNCTQDPRYILRNFPPLDYWSIGRALNLLIPLTTIIGAVISGAFFLYGGYTYVRASGDPKKLADAIHTITYSAAGLIFVMIAYVLVRTVLYMTNTNNFGF